MKKQGDLFFLNSIPGLGTHTIWQLLQEFKNPEQIIIAAQDNQHSQTKWASLIKSALKNKKDLPEITENFLTILDPDYPPLLKTIYDPPLFLFYRGNKKILQSEHILTMVGSRQITAYHQSIVQKLTSDLENTPLVISSGLALGIDSECHRAALKNNLKTIAVLGSGLNPKVLYPQDNINLAQKIVEQGGLLISEYPSLTRPELYFFPKRNRILAGFAKATVVISGAQKSGTLVTAQIALDENREVFALPGNINMYLCQGPNSLLAAGARVLLSSQNILEFYNLIKNNPDFILNFENKIQAQIYNLLKIEPLTLEAISQKINQPLNQILPFISQLELKNLIRTNEYNQLEII